MQDIVTQPAVKRNYNFVDAIRGLAMLCIVADHCFHVEEHKFAAKNVNFWVYATDVQLVKIGTVCFFLLAGFLLGDKFADYSARDYLKRRVNNTFRPWIIWSLVFLFFVIKVNPRDENHILTWFLADAKIVYLMSNYWFIINFFICISILLAFKKHLYSLVFGAILLCCTLFYSVNIYFEWIYPAHTTAIFGFVFFLWLGAQMHKRWTAIENFVLKMPLIIFVAAVIGTLALAVFETANLYYTSSLDPFNSLRIGNILYSIAVFFLLVKINKYDLLLKLKPRETTYGIYLIHYIIIYYFLADWVSGFKSRPVEQMTLAGMLTYQVSCFLIIYILTFIIVRILNAFSFTRWIIGR